VDVDHVRPAQRAVETGNELVKEARGLRHGGAFGLTGDLD
jgi:hypothetical protein